MATPSSKYEVEEQSGNVQENNWTSAPNPGPPLERLNKVKEKRKQEVDRCKFLYILVGLPLSLAVTIVMIVIGAVKLDQCPAAPVIPKLLLVYGSLSVSSVVLKILPDCEREEIFKTSNRSRCTKVTCSFIEFLLDVIKIVLFALAIALSVFVFKIFTPNYVEKESENYCDQVLYVFSLGVVIVSLIGLSIIPLALICCCFCCVGYWCSKIARRRRQRIRESKIQQDTVTRPTTENAVTEADDQV